MKYRITNWAEHQHYKDRAPPWIKLHQTILTSETWVTANDETRVLMVASMLLASRNKTNDGTFNGDSEYVKRVAYLNSIPNFKPLIENGFLEVLQDASKPLASCITEESRDRVEIENKNPSASPNGECLGDVKNPLYTKAFLAFWELYPNRKNKGDAAKAFVKIKAAEYPSIRAGLEVAIASPDWKKNNGQFIPHPGTWLRARGWEDESPSGKVFNLDEFMRQA